MTARTAPTTHSAQRKRTVRLDMARLRRAADLLRRVTGLRVEIDEPLPRTPAPRCGKHAAAVAELTQGLRPLLPPGRTVVQQAGVCLGEGRDYVVPDLTVCPARFLGSDDPYLHPQDVDLAVEVVLRTATSAHIHRAVDRYTAAGIRALLVVDPRPAGARACGTWALHAEPVGGHYRAVWRGTFRGARGVPLPPPFRGVLATRDLPVYGR